MDCAKRSENGLKWKIWTQLHHNENSSVMQLPSAANQIRVATDTKQAREMKLSCESPEKVRRLGERRKKISYLHLVFTWSDDCPFCVLLSIGICICKWLELLRRHTESSTRHVEATAVSIHTVNHFVLGLVWIRRLHVRHEEEMSKRKIIKIYSLT